VPALEWSSRDAYEELVAELFSGFGYDVELTRRTRDGGRDVVAVKSSETAVKYLIECKRPDPGGYVGVRPVRELFGVKQDEGATKAILATTAYFSPDALLFFERHKWELEPKDHSGVTEWIEDYVRRSSVRRSEMSNPPIETGAKRTRGSSA
jgi:restriction system protein